MSSDSKRRQRFSPSAIASVEPDPRGAVQIANEFKRLVASGTPIRCVGAARDRPERLLTLGYTPKARIDLFGTTFYLTHARQNPDLRFFVAYVVQRHPRTGRRVIYPRVFYKDISLIWRVASHIFEDGEELWIGKGDTRTEWLDGEEIEFSVEATTDLPLEMQSAVETINRRVRRPKHDVVGPGLVLQHAPKNRIEPYREFVEPRRRAARLPKDRVYGGRKALRFTRRNDPTSLWIAPGLEPEFTTRALLEVTHGRSSLYRGVIRRFRFLSRNREIQYLIFESPEHAWIIPPQTVQTELTTFGVRPIEVVADEDVFVPGYEYHFLEDDDDPDSLHSQIPEGYVGALHELDDSRADASAWLDRLPIVLAFRRFVARYDRRA